MHFLTFEFITFQNRKNINTVTFAIFFAIILPNFKKIYYHLIPKMHVLMIFGCMIFVNLK